MAPHTDWWQEKCYSSKTGASATARCGLRNGAVGGRAAPSNGLLNRGPQRLWYTGPMFATNERPRRSPAPISTKLRVSNCGFRPNPAADAERERDRPGPADSPGTGIWPWRSNVPRDACDRSHTAACWWNCPKDTAATSSTPKPRGGIRPTRCGSSTAKIPRPRPCSPPHPCSAICLSATAASNALSGARPGPRPAEILSAQSQAGYGGAGLLHPQPPLEITSSELRRPGPRSAAWPLRNRPDRAAGWQPQQRRFGLAIGLSGWCCCPGRPWPRPCIHWPGRCM